MIVDQTLAQRGADLGFDRGRRVRAMPDQLERIAAAASIDRIVADATADLIRKGATPDQGACFALGYRAAFDAGVAGVEAVKLTIRKARARAD